VSYKFFLLKFHGQLDAMEVLHLLHGILGPIPSITVIDFLVLFFTVVTVESLEVVIVGKDSQFVISSYMIQETDSKGGHPLPQVSILDGILLLDDTETFEFPTQLEGSQYWIPRGEGNERRRA
jgi:hypothetical protein